MKIIKSISAVIFFFFAQGLLLGQYKYSNPIEPQMNDPLERNLGFFIGFGQNVQSGKHYVDCEACEFMNGTGFGFTAGALYEEEFWQDIFFGGALSYDIRNTASSYVEIEDVDFVLSNGEHATAPVSFRHTGEADFSYLSLTPYFKYEFSSLFFFRLGIDFSFNISNHLKHTKSALESRVTIAPGVTGRLSVTDETVQDGPFPEAGSFLLGLSPAIGMKMLLDPNVFFSPVFSYGLPFSAASQFGQDFKVSTWRLLLELRFGLDQKGLNAYKRK